MIHDSPFPLYECPSLASFSSLPKQGAQGMPGARRTHCLACKTGKNARRSTQVRRNHSGTPCAMALRLTPRSSWCAGFLATIVCAACRAERPTSPIRKLDSSIGEPEPHGLTVRDRAARLAARPRPSHPAPRFVTTAKRLFGKCRIASYNHKFLISER
jgi:hypothetical protein